MVGRLTVGALLAGAVLGLFAAMVRAEDTAAARTAASEEARRDTLRRELARLEVARLEELRRIESIRVRAQREEARRYEAWRAEVRRSAAWWRWVRQAEARREEARRLEARREERRREAERRQTTARRETERRLEATAERRDRPVGEVRPQAADAQKPADRPAPRSDTEALKAVRIEHADDLLKAAADAFDAKHYLDATLIYQTLLAKYADLDAAKTARERLEAIKADPAVAAEVESQRREREATSLLSLADMYEANGLREKAVPRLKEFLAKFPDHAKAPAARARIEVLEKRP